MTHSIAKLADDPFLDQYSLLVFSRLSVEPIPETGDIHNIPMNDSQYYYALQRHVAYHEQRGS